LSGASEGGSRLRRAAGPGGPGAIDQCRIAAQDQWVNDGGASCVRLVDADNTVCQHNGGIHRSQTIRPVRFHDPSGKKGKELGAGVVDKSATIALQR
jgi:hypothetical protein